MKFRSAGTKNHPTKTVYKPGEKTDHPPVYKHKIMVLIKPFMTVQYSIAQIQI